MKPVNQKDTTFQTGDCMNACIASILEIPLEHIPNFHTDDPKDGEAFTRNMREWCRKFGFVIVDIGMNEGHDPKDFFKDCWCIASGLSPRGTKDWHRHAVVWRNGKIVHDPHPSKAGLKEIETYAVFITLEPKDLIENDRHR